MSRWNFGGFYESLMIRYGLRRDLELDTKSPHRLSPGGCSIDGERQERSRKEKSLFFAQKVKIFRTVLNIAEMFASDWPTV